MDTWRVGFKADMLRLVQRQHEDAYLIVDWEEETEYGGYCETCSYEEIVVKVTYTCNTCDECPNHVYKYYGRFSELMKDLIRND